MSPRHPKHVLRSRLPRRLGELVAVLLILSFGVAAAPLRGASPVTVLVTADAEGHVGPCEACPTNVGHGGLARRATLVARIRSQEAVLLLDAGNWLAGMQSASSEGEVITAAYDAIGYDAVHITPKDLYFGKAKTLALLGKSKFTAVSATLLDADTGRPLFQPFVVKEAGGQKIAVLGVSEPPPGLDSLPLLQSQLAGVRLRPVADAIDEWLTKAKAQSDRVVLLYEGNGRGLRAVRTKLAGSGVLICVAGVRLENAPEGEPIVVATELHGKSVARAAMTDGKVSVTQLGLTPDVPSDPGVAELLGRYQQREAIVAVPAPAIGVPNPGTGEHTAAVSNPSTAPANPSVPPTVAMAAAPAPAPAAPPAAPSPSTAPAGPELTRVAARSNRIPKGLAGVGLTSDQVNLAIERGRDFLWAHLRADLEKTHRRFGTDQNDVLEALALVHAGAQLRYPEFDAILRDYLTRLDLIHEDIGTYRMGIVGMLIGDYADPIFYPKMRMLARSLVEQQLADGSWHYGRLLDASAFDDLNTGPALSVEGGVPLDDPTRAPPAMTRVLPFEKHEPGDNSTSQFAMLGLRAAARVRVHPAPEVWQRSLRAFHASRVPTTGGWAYQLGDSSAYGSMTCAGLCSLAIARFELGEKEPAADPDIETGLAWLDSHFSVTANPQRGTYLYYYLYSLERVGRILDTEFIGSHEWYPLGAKYLVEAQQKDGSWLEAPDQDPRQPTSFALLFLTRATQTLNVELKRGGQGQVTTTVATPPPARLYVILDASGSMLDDIGGRQKFDIARDAVSEMLAGLPETAEVALRVYGHRKRSLEPGSDEDTALEFSMAKIDRPKLKELLKRLRPRGKTPLALSLQQAKQDLASLSGQPVTIVLLTDGGEDTMPRRDPVKAAKELGAVSGVSFQVIGFDINQADWGQQLHLMADAGGGHYWPASRAGMLAKELRAAVFGIPADFTLYDDTRKVVGTGEFGTAKTLPEGKYQLKTEFAGQQFATDLWVNTGAATGVVFDASRVKGQPAPSRTPQTQLTGEPPPPVVSGPHFCTHCGHALPPGAKFCPACGQPVPH